MKISEIRELTGDELAKQLTDAKGELFRVRFQLALRQLENTAKLKELRHTIAQLQTVVRERELAGRKESA